jgi:alanine racemase
VVLKLASSMRRYGVVADQLAALVDAASASGFAVHAYALHLPLVTPPGDGDDRVDGPSGNLAEADAWLTRLPSGSTLHVSHLSIDELSTLAASHPSMRIVHRVGTALWLGDGKDGLHLGAEVVEVRPCRAGETAGYRATVVAHDGHLVMVGAGTAHGVHALANGLSPFHYGRRRLALVESPHMHTSMVLVPVGDPCPAPGDVVDVQRPLTQTFVDRVVG